VKIYTLLTAANKTSLPDFVDFVQRTRATGATVFAFPTSFAPEPTETTNLVSRIADLTKQETDAATKREYILASQIREKIGSLEARAKELQNEASSWYKEQVAKIDPILSTVILDQNSWKPDLPPTDVNFVSQIPNISVQLTTTGIRGKKQPTPLEQRAYVPLSLFGSATTAPTPTQTATQPTQENPFGLPDTLSPNQRSFAEALLSKKATTKNQAARLSGISPIVAKKTMTDITKKWPEFPSLVPWASEDEPTEE
jgi:hypothetical protein